MSLTILCKYDKIYKIPNQKGAIKLSVRNELTTLGREKEDLEKRVAKMCTTLDNLYAQKSPLVQKAEILSTRTSSLAQTLLEKVQEKLEKINQEIVQAKTARTEAIKEWNEINQKILERDSDFSLYIEEQSSMMISTFFEYVRSHLEDIGAEIKKTYRIMEVTRFQDDRHYGCDIPTGDIGIYDESNKSFIVISKDFYFKHTLYTITRGEYDALICHKTDWYKNYHDNFISLLTETLQNNYSFDEVLKLTIEKPYFTLELV